MDALFANASLRHAHSTPALTRTASMPVAAPISPAAAPSTPPQAPAHTPHPHAALAIADAVRSMSPVINEAIRWQHRTSGRADPLPRDQLRKILLTLIEVGAHARGASRHAPQSDSVMDEIHRTYQRRLQATQQQSDEP